MAHGCGEKTVNLISEQALERLQALVRSGEAMSTDQARDVLELSPQQFHRMTLQDDFPQRSHIGRKFWLNPERLLAFCQLWNRLAGALTITDVARLIRTAVPTARRITRQAGFPAPLGKVNDKPRWDEDEVLAWHAPRVEGAKLPAHVHAPIPKGKKKRPVKGNGNGKSAPKRRNA